MARRRVLLRCIIAFAAVALAACNGDLPDRSLADTTGFTADVWFDVLGGDDPSGVGLSDGRLAPLNDPATSPMPAAEFAAANAAAEAFVVADVTGQGRTARLWPAWTTPAAATPAAGACTSIDVAAVNTQPLPSPPGWYKTAVVWSAEGCPIDVSVDPSGRTVTFVFLERAGDSFVVHRRVDVPGADPIGLQPAGEIPDWMLASLDCAKSTAVKARVEVAAAWAQLCRVASIAGINLIAVEGVRSAADQRDRFGDAVEFFGDSDRAQRYVAASDGSLCASRHCAAEAVDVIADPETIGWLTETAACVGAEGTRILDPGQSCGDTERPVPRSLRYGFASTLPHSPGHLDYVVPLAPVEPGTCAVPQGAQPPQLIVVIWTCTLTGAGLTADDLTRTVAAALTVADCASSLQPSAAEFGGAYLDAAHPDLGRAWDRVGLFSMPRAWVAQFAGPDASPYNPAVAAAAAAQMWVTERAAGRDPWAEFGCAVGDEFHSPVLPAYGGPPLPAWALSAAGTATVTT